METLASQRLVDLRHGGDDRKKKYRSVSEKLGNIIRLKSYRDERFPRKHYSMSPHILVRRIESFLSYSLELNQYFKKMLVRFIGRLELSAACPHVGKLFVGVKTQTFVYSLVVCSVLWQLFCPLSLFTSHLKRSSWIFSRTACK